MPAVYECPAGDGVGRGVANYLAIVGRRSAWPEHLSLNIRDFHDGSSNTLLLVESADSNINWLEPRDITVKQLLKWNKANSAPSCCSRHPGEPNRHVLFGDGAVRRLADSFQMQMLGGLITPSSEGTAASKLLPFDGGDPPEAVFPKQRDVLQTDVVPVPSAAIVKGRNSLYCCTLRMAWDELRQPPDNTVHVTQPPSIVYELNKVPFPKGCLAPENSLVQIESLADVGKIHAELARRFPGAQGPRTPPSNQPGFVVFTYLRKSLPFAAHFELLDQPLNFPRGSGGQPVARFGRLGSSSSPSDERLQQVQVHSYDSENDFQGLRLPDFDARFGGAVASIENVIQGIAFVLNERGAEVESFAEIGVVGSDGDDREPIPRRRFVFDQPFLVLLSERDAAEPYFALWIENTELMEIAR